MKDLVFSSKHPYVDKTNRWIASLSDGSTVFEDRTPKSVSAWNRLTSYLKLHGLKLTNLRLESYGRVIKLVPYKDTEGNAQLNGYWQASRIARLASDSYNSEALWHGIGYIKYKTIHITWVSQDGVITQEERPLYTIEEDEDGNEYKRYDLGIILNDEI